MQDPDPEFEKKVLRDVVEQMKDPDQTMRKQAGLRRLVYGIGFFGLVAAFFMALNGLAHSVIVAFVAGMAGFALGFALFLDFSQKQWPVTTKFIDMDRVRARLTDLEK